MRATYKNIEVFPSVNDKVHKQHPYDGTINSGKKLPRVYTIVRLHSVDPQINACYDRTYAELDDGTFSYVWNLYLA